VTDSKPIFNILNCILFLIFVFLVSNVGKAQTDSNNNRIKTQNMQWYYTRTTEKTKGVCLVIHGLNLEPARMDPICALLREMGMDVLLVSLQGHGNNFTQVAGQSGESDSLESFKNVTLNGWLEEINTGYKLALKRSSEYQVPLYFVGFSLGGLLGPLFLDETPYIRFDKMGLFAPALAVRKKVYLLKIFTPFPRLVIPSQSREFYRANRGTPMAAYRALFTGLAQLHQERKDAMDIPTLIFLDRKDEFIPYAGIQKMIARSELDHWKICEVTKDPDIDRSVKHHLVIDESVVGAQMWEEIWDNIQNHLLR